LRDLKPQFQKCRPGTRLVSHDFQIENVKVHRTEEVALGDSNRHFVHLYVTPLVEVPPPPPLKFPLPPAD
jgi:hypothetical protein